MEKTENYDEDVTEKYGTEENIESDENEETYETYGPEENYDSKENQESDESYENEENHDSKENLISVEKSSTFGEETKLFLENHFPQPLLRAHHKMK